MSKWLMAVHRNSLETPHRMKCALFLSSSKQKLCSKYILMIYKQQELNWTITYSLLINSLVNWCLFAIPYSSDVLMCAYCRVVTS